MLNPRRRGRNDLHSVVDKGEGVGVNCSQPMATAPPDSVIANIVTGESMILGAIRLPHTAVGSVTYHFRFLELLNNPRLGGMQSDRLRDSIALSDVYVLPKKGPRISVADELFVRPE